jgi:hypothetical protein
MIDDEVFVIALSRTGAWATYAEAKAEENGQIEDPELDYLVFRSNPEAMKGLRELLNRNDEPLRHLGSAPKHRWRIFRLKTSVQRTEWAPCPSCGDLSNVEHRRYCKGVQT